MFLITLAGCLSNANGGCAQVTAGSADRMVYIWDAASRALLYKLPGHTGSVNEASFHPTQPIIGSASSDKTVSVASHALCWSPRSGHAGDWCTHTHVLARVGVTCADVAGAGKPTCDVMWLQVYLGELAV